MPVCFLEQLHTVAIPLQAVNKQMKLYFFHENLHKSL